MGAIFDKTAYEWNTVITGFEVDMFDRLKLSALMKRHQEVGELHLNEFGTSSDIMRSEQNIAFVFTKVNIKVHDLPRSEEKVTIRTWCSSLKGVRFTRNYVMFGESGNVMTEAKGEVTTIDLVNRRIVRPTEINSFKNFLYNNELENSADYPQKLHFPENCAEKHQRRIHFSDIDYNGHVNNTVYADMVLDCLDLETLKKPIKGFEINFINEVLLSETLEIGVLQDGDERLFSGNVNDRNCFTARLAF